jgi:hypothetical protein
MPQFGAAEALSRQEPFINQNLAYQAMDMLTQLLRHGSISYQGGFCNLESGQLVPVPIPYSLHRIGVWTPMVSTDAICHESAGFEGARGPFAA